MNGVPITEQELSDSSNWLESLNLGFVKLIGQFYSWNSGGAGSERILSRMDHCLGNGKWLQEFPEAVVHYQCPVISSHSPLVITVKERGKEGGRPFKFFNNLVLHSRFEALVKEA